jgi:pimeloyl-ACP methyl ester carboxylesterase
MFEYQTLALLEAGYRVITYDRRGFGQSGHPTGPYDYDTFADDLAAILESRDISGATLVGFSMSGGEVARYLSRHGPTRVAKAVLISSVTPYLQMDDSNPEASIAQSFNHWRWQIRCNSRPRRRRALYGRALRGIPTQLLSDLTKRPSPRSRGHAGQRLNEEASDAGNWRSETSVYGSAVVEAKIGSWIVKASM